MLKKLGSLRVRITLFATLAVTAALVAAASGLVITMENTLLGRLQNAAIERMDEVAQLVAAGKDPQEAFQGGGAVLVQVLDEEGDVVDAIPDTVFAFGCDEECPETFEAPAPSGSAVFVERLPAIENAPSRETIVRQLDSEELILAQKTVESPDGTRTVVAISPFSGVSRSVDTVVNALWIGTPFLIAFVALVSWYFTGRTLKPVADMTRRAEEISHSTLADRLPRPEADDEVARLAVTLNSMLARLEEAAKRQREFVSDASHELRSPIATMKAQLEVALARPTAANWEQVARDVLGESDRLEGLVGDLLALARVEELGSNREPVDLSDLVVDEVARRHDSRVRTQVGRAVVSGDRDQLERVVANLLDNARRHAAERVDVSVSRSDGVVVLAVDDDGPGIPESERHRIFDRFARLDDARARDSGGLGIGLALVARIVEGHDAAIRCDASRLGGARFEIRLPAVS